MGRYRDKEDREQLNLFPMSLEDLIDSENPVRLIDVIVENLDIAALGFKYAVTAETGRRPYDPADMLKLYLYSYYNGIRTSRKIERECKRNIEVMWLTGNQTPNHKTISEFRRNNKHSIQKAYKEFNKLCYKMGLCSRDIVVADGSKFRAWNRKDNYYTKAKVSKQLEMYQERMEQYLETLDLNDSTDAEEVQRQMNATQSRIAFYQEMAIRIEKEGPVCTTDSEARNMLVNNGGHDISYNVQIAVEPKNHLVVAVDATNDGMDYKQLHNISAQAKAVMDTDVLTVLADKGYYSAEEFQKCKADAIRPIVPKPKRGHSQNSDFYKSEFEYCAERDVYICPAGKELFHHKHTEANKTSKELYANTQACKACAMRNLCTNRKSGRRVTRCPNDIFADEVDADTKANKHLLRIRKSTVEHCFGIVKGGWGFSHFLTRGLEGVRTEACLHFWVYNIKRVIRILGVRKLQMALTLR